MALVGGVQAEERTITALSNGNQDITLDQPLRFMHFGNVTFGVPQFAEVALLTRTLVVRGEASDADGFGGHMMFRSKPAAVHLSGLEVTKMGQRGVMGKAWHLVPLPLLLSSSTISSHSPHSIFYAFPFYVSQADTPSTGT